MIVVAGIDVSKCNSGRICFGRCRSPLRKQPQGHPQPAEAYRPDQGVTRAVCESTGGYERLLVSRLKATVIGVLVAHPLRVRALARAYFFEAKTDPLDAQVQSRYGVVYPRA